jgi:hypothetical protein
VTLGGGSLGGAGVVTLGLLHPARFAAIHAQIPLLSRSGPRWRLPAEERRAAGDSSGPDGNATGATTATTTGNAARRDASRLADVLPIDPAGYVAAHPDTEFPFLLVTAGRTDHIVGWPDKVALARAAATAKAGFILYWDARGHSGSPDFPPTWGRPGGRETVPLTSFSRRQTFPALAALTADDDPGTVDLAVPPGDRPPLNTPGVGDLVGTINGAVDWDRDTIVDELDRYEITLRLHPWVSERRTPGPTGPTATITATVTPRRTQAFRPEPGERVRYAVTDRASGSRLVAGHVTADAHRRVSVDKVSILRGGVRLTLWRDGAVSLAEAGPMRDVGAPAGHVAEAVG